MKTVLFKTIHFNMSKQLFIWPLDSTISGVTTPGQNGPGSNGNKGVLCIPQSSSITGSTAWNVLVSYSGHLLGEFHPSAKIQSVYFTNPVD